MKIEKGFLPVQTAEKPAQTAPVQIKKGFSTRKAVTAEDFDESLKRAGDIYEKQFLRQMVRAMRSTISEGSLIPTNQAEKIFREQLDEQHVESWGDNGGIGLGDMIHKQLRGFYGLDRTAPAPRGPIQIGEKFKIEASGAKKTNIRYELAQSALKAGPAEVTAPWGGSLVGAQKINPDEYLLEMNHDNGLKSKMVYRGSLDPQFQNAQGQEIQAGLRIGLLSPEAKSFFWTVDSL
jgi:peptidoglycan hydrolase FlgJ